jgi:glycosyltransferase involved in cell wall biosynthesis
MPIPLVSIVIPCYNAELYIRRAVESALTQTYENVEVLIVDDGSTDKTPSIVREFDGKVTLIRQPHSGGSAARNKGLNCARGEFVQFLDADDALASEKVKEQMTHLLSTGVDLVYSDWFQYEAHPPGEKRRCGVDSGATDDSVILALKRQNITVESPIHRKEVLLRVGGFREDLPCCQERDLHLRLACEGFQFYHLPKALHTVYASRDSVSSNELRVLSHMRSVLWNAYRTLERCNQLTLPRRMAFAALMASQARRFFLHGKPDQAAVYFQEARQMELNGGLREAYGAFGFQLLRLFGPAFTETALLWIKKAKRGIKQLVPHRVFVAYRDLQSRAGGA